MQRRLLGTLAAAGLVAVSAACGSTRTTLVLARCTAQGVPARCGTLTVQEDPSKPNGRTIGLNVVVVPAAHRPALPDAFTYLPGGPGGAATDSTSWVMDTFRSVHARHDIVLVDQRGTGSSHPLACALPNIHSTRPPRRVRMRSSACAR